MKQYSYKYSESSLGTLCELTTTITDNDGEYSGEHYHLFINQNIVLSAVDPEYFSEGLFDISYTDNINNIKICSPLSCYIVDRCSRDGVIDFTMLHNEVYEAVSRIDLCQDNSSHSRRYPIKTGACKFEPEVMCCHECCHNNKFKLVSRSPEYMLPITRVKSARK